MVCCLLDRRSHRGRRPEDAVQPRVIHHRDDRGHAASLVADELRPRAVELDLARRVRAIAELVLEPLDPKRVSRAVWEHPRQKEAREPVTGLRQHEEGVAHRCRAEPLVADELVRSVGGRPRDGRVRAHVGAALLLRHRHAAQRSALLGGRPQAEVVLQRRQQRLPTFGKLRLRPKRRNRGVRHRDRTAVSGLDLRHQKEQRRACDLCAGPGFAPGERVKAVLDARPHQQVPGRMELDLVDSVPEAVVGAQPRRLLVREAAPLERFGGKKGAERSRSLRGPPGALALEGFDERPVLEEEVVADERRRLIRSPVAGRRRHHAVKHARTWTVTMQPMRSDSAGAILRSLTADTAPVHKAHAPTMVQAGRRSRQRRTR